MLKGNNKIFFISRGKSPKVKKVTYGGIVAEIRPQKIENQCICLTVRGDRLDFDRVTETQCAGLVTTKMLFNSTVSTLGAKFCIFDIKDFYYGRPMSNCEYTRIQLSVTPKEIIDQYDLETIKHEGWVYIEIQKGMPGLNQSSKIANDRLCTH